MPAAKATFIADLLEEHFEELAFLWAQRSSALRSSRHGMADLQRLEERIEAHVQGLLVQKQAARGLVEPGLSARDASVSFAAAYVLLRSDDPESIAQATQALLRAKGAGLDGIVQSMCHAPGTAALTAARQAAASTDANVAIAGRHIQAFHDANAIKPGQLDRFIAHPEPSIRASAWKVAAICPQAAPRQAGAFQTGLKDKDAAVRHAALEAAVWSAQPWLLSHLRTLGAGGDLASCVVFAALAGPEDLPDILRIAQNAALGPARLGALGVFGHPGGIDLLLRQMANHDPATAAAAGAAFLKITGKDCSSGKRAQAAPPPGAQIDDFDQAFLDEVMLPDASAARSHWDALKDTFSTGARWCRGINVTSDVPESDWSHLDMESRWQLRLRARFRRTWSGRLPDLEALSGCSA